MALLRDLTTYHILTSPFSYSNHPSRTCSTKRKRHIIQLRALTLRLSMLLSASISWYTRISTFLQGPSQNQKATNHPQVLPNLQRSCPPIPLVTPRTPVVRHPFLVYIFLPRLYAISKQPPMSAGIYADFYIHDNLGHKE